MRNKMVLYTDRLRLVLSYNRKILTLERSLWFHTQARCCEILSQVKKCTTCRGWEVLEVTAIDYIYSIGIKNSNITAGRILPSWLIWGMLVLLEDAPPHIHHRGLASWVEAGASLSGHRRHDRDTRIHLSGTCQHHQWICKVREECAFFLPYFLLRCPNSFTKVSLCERKWRVSRWSAAVNHLDVPYCISMFVSCAEPQCVFSRIWIWKWRLSVHFVPL